MKDFTIHTVETAPETSKELLNTSLTTFGRIPNLHGIMAESPELLKGYQILHELFANTSFTAEELTVVWQTINVEHNCHYCVPAHTAIALAMKVDTELIEALRNQEPMTSPKLQILQDTTLAMVRKRGELSDEELKAFYGSGYTKQNMLEIVLGLAQKVMSNYVNHIADTPVDRAFEKFAWEKKN